MAGKFEPVTLSWKGEQFVVAPERTLPLIAAIEDALMGPGGEPPVAMLTRQGGPGYARLSAAYGAALRYAGAQVTDEEIYTSIQEDFAASDNSVAVKVQGAILGLLAIISPPVSAKLTGGAAKKKPAPKRAKKNPGKA